MVCFGGKNAQKGMKLKKSRWSKKDIKFKNTSCQSMAHL